ncbi:PASTA domain-containing protein [Gordonia paraffinivorans]|uniref:PASTA domain-containing protein n=1 Tax=Gordonia paraffinivorans TaxID=175628 RepID=UPI0014462903|nr:PASTA domain-containing protein [Gordonia paraffinivorans]
MRSSFVPLAAAVSVSLAAATACGATTDERSGAAVTSPLPTTTVTETMTGTTPAPAPGPARRSQTETPPPPTTGAPIMPDVVCMNLQDAQDRIQEAGVFFSRSEDATGRRRSQILDRNWIVVSQTPSPGTPFGEGEAVLAVVKIGEPHDC